MKAMSVGMIFGIIFTIIVISLLLVFGNRAISFIFCYSSDAQVSRTILSLESTVDDLYTLTEGNSNVFNLNIPGGTLVCFVNPNDPSPNLRGDWNPDPVYQTIISEDGYTIWYEHCSGKSGRVIEYLLPKENFCAGPGTGIYLENKGTWVEASKI